MPTLIGERQRERERRLERLAAGQRLHGAALVGVAVVDHFELVAIVDASAYWPLESCSSVTDAPSTRNRESLVHDPLLESVGPQQPGELLATSICSRAVATRFVMAADSLMPATMRFTSADASCSSAAASSRNVPTVGSRRFGTVTPAASVNLTSRSTHLSRGSGLLVCALRLLGRELSVRRHGS